MLSVCKKIFDYAIIGGDTTIDKGNKKSFKLGQFFIYFVNNMWLFYIF